MVSLKDILFKSNQIKVLVIGDLILDEYIWGTVNRISPEAPIQILQYTSKNEILGGACNVANNLMSLGCNVHICGAVGDDKEGHELLDVLEQKGINTNGVVIDPSRPTTHKVRVIAHTQQLLRIDREVTWPISNSVLKKVIGYLIETIPKVDGIICSDYQKGLLVHELLDKVIHYAKIHTIGVVLDPKGSDFSRYKGVDVITPNLEEVKNACHIDITNEDELDRAVKSVFCLTKPRAVLVTRGKDGMTLYDKAGNKTHIPAETREIYDVTGAGDTVTAVFSLGLFCNAGLIAAARLANKAAGIVVGKVGTAIISGEELAHYLDEGPRGLTQKIINLDECKQALSQVRNHGRKIVFTNGCFDLLHIGHIHFLQAAKRHGDLLVVGLNDDLSVRQLKGPKQPLIGQNERAKILAALDCVDYVILFSNSTPEALLSELKPDVLVKGGNHTPHQVPGRNLVEGYGGRVEIIPLFPGQSTSRLVQSILHTYADDQQSNPGESSNV